MDGGDVETVALQIDLDTVLGSVGFAVLNPSASTICAPPASVYRRNDRAAEAESHTLWKPVCTIDYERSPSAMGVGCEWG